MNEISNAPLLGQTLSNSNSKLHEIILGVRECVFDELPFPLIIEN